MTAEASLTSGAANRHLASLQEGVNWLAALDNIAPGANKEALTRLGDALRAVGPASLPG